MHTSRASFAALLLFALPAFAQVTDYSSRPPASTTVPNRNIIFHDTAFGTTLVRITDDTTTDDNGTRTVCAPAYSYWQAFSRDDNHLLLDCDGGAFVFDFNPRTMSVGSTGQALGGGSGTILPPEGASWSLTEPNIIYAVGGSTPESLTSLYRIEVGQGGTPLLTQLIDLKTLTFNASPPYAGRLWQAKNLSVSSDNRFFSFDAVLLDSSGNPLPGCPGRLRP